MGLLTIEFEDHGQDFLEWDVDQSTGKIVESRPFQTSVWGKYYVLSPQVKVGDKVEIIDVPPYALDLDTEVLRVKYQVKSITIKPN